MHTLTSTLSEAPRSLMEVFISPQSRPQKKSKNACDSDKNPYCFRVSITAAGRKFIIVGATVGRLQELLENRTVRCAACVLIYQKPTVRCGICRGKQRTVRCCAEHSGKTTKREQKRRVKNPSKTRAGQTTGRIENTRDPVRFLHRFCCLYFGYT